MKNEMLPNELLWLKAESGDAHMEGAEGAHASDVALAAVADGETALVPASLMAHVEQCASCTHRLGEAALFSAGLGTAIAGLGPLTRITPVPASVRRRMPLPLPMMAAAVVIAILGAAPTVAHLPTRLAGFMLTLLHSLPAISHGGAQLLRSGLGPAGVVVTFASALLLVMLSAVLTRVLPRPASNAVSR